MSHLILPVSSFCLMALLLLLPGNANTNLGSDGQFSVNKSSTEGQQSGTVNSEEVVATSWYQHNNDTFVGVIQIPFIGLTTMGLSPSLAERLGLDTSTRGDVVIDVVPGSPAERLGLQIPKFSRIGTTQDAMGSRGDIIVSINGSSSFATNYRTIEEYIMENTRVGDNITLRVLQNGQLKDLETTVMSRPRFLSYINTAEGFQIKYPSDWKEIEAKNKTKEVVVQFESAEKSSLLGAPVVTVSVLKYVSKHSEQAETTGSDKKNEVHDFRLLGANETRLDNRSGYSVIYYDYSGNDDTRKIMNVIAEYNSYLYSLDFNIIPSKYEDYLPIIREMIKSFHFI